VIRPKLLVATRSTGKQREIRELLADLPYEIVFPDDQGLVELPDEAGVEDAGSFEGNARRKAEYFARRARLPTVAEDSGLEVLSLGGRPGVRSRRFAFPPRDDPVAQDRANIEELLRQLSGAPPSRRRARYRAVAVFLPRFDAAPRSFEGACDGRILDTPRGAGGFGYDPLFWSDELQQTFAQAAPADKAAVSHRGRAFRAFADWLRTQPIG